MSEDGDIDRRKFNAKILGSVMAGSIGLTGWAVSYDGNSEESFSESVDEYVDQAFRELGSENYENFQTDRQAMSIEKDPAENGVYLTVGLDTDGDDVEDIGNLLQQEAYQKQGADIFSTFAGSLLESEEVDVLGLEYDLGFGQNETSHRFDADEVREATEGDQGLEEYYRDVILSF